MDDITYLYQHGIEQHQAHLILHGVTEGIDSKFIQNIFKSLKTKTGSLLAFNFPYINAGTSPSDQLDEEVSALHTAIIFLQAQGISTIHIVAKSLGGIVVSYWYEHHKPADIKITLTILGYVLGDVHTKTIKPILLKVIQGGLDDYGNAEAVKNELNQYDIVASVIEIADADHSYRDSQGNPTHQQQAIQAI